jgi:hypothetical protein
VSLRIVRLSMRERERERERERVCDLGGVEVDWGENANPKP